jgi:type VI secretion system secreted protein VgrG
MFTDKLSKPPRFAEQFATLLNARERTIEIAFPNPESGGPPPGSVLPQRVSVTEALSTPFEVVVHALAELRWFFHTEDGTSVHRGTKAHPEEFLGRQARVVVRAEGHQRTFDGIVTGTRQLGHWDLRTESATGFQLIELVIRPGLALFAHRRTCRIFHAISPIEVVQEVLLEHQMHNPGVADTLGDVIGAIPRNPCPRRYLTQYKESDLDFVQRLIASEGCHYLLPNDTQRFGHRMELIGAGHRLRAEPDIELYGDGHTGLVEDGLPLRHWHGRRQLGIARTRLSSPDYKGRPLDADVKGRDLDTFHRTNGPFGEYLPLSPNARAAGDGFDRGAFAFDRDAELRQMAHDAEAERYEGETVAPLPLAGVLRITGLEAHRHTRRKDNPHEITHRSTPFDYVVTRQTLIAHVPLHGDLHQRLAADLDELDRRAGLDLFGRQDADTGPRVRSIFHALPIDQPIAPDPSRLTRQAPGALTGRVIGYPGATQDEVRTDEFGRIGVLLDWQRPADYRSSNTKHHYEHGEPITWLRYVQPGAGRGIGFQYLPRVGDEVLVLFLDDDPDRPVAIGSLYSPRQLPPQFGGVGALPENATLTGLRTREHHGRGSNELCLDDSRGEVGLRLASSTADTALTLGHIATPRNKGKATHRGTGVELRTEGAAALRAAQGLLLTTFGVAEGAPHLAHAQTGELLRKFSKLLDELATTIESIGMSPPKADGRHDVERALDAWNKHPGQTGTPAVVISGPAPIVMSSAKSQMIGAGTDIDLAAMRNLQLHSGEHTSIAAGTGIRAYTEKGGITAYAREGDAVIRAPAGSLRLEAGKDIDLHAREGTIRLHAPNIEIVTKDGSYITLADAIEAGTRGLVTIHSEHSHFVGPKARTIDTSPSALSGDESEPQYLKRGHDEKKYGSTGSTR